MQSRHETATPSPTPRQAAADKLDNAYAEFIREGDSTGDAFVAAYDYREEGYRIGEEAADMCAEDREDWIDGETYRFDASARYLIACAADFRVEELEAEASRLATVEKASLFLSGIAA